MLPGSVGDGLGHLINGASPTATPEASFILSTRQNASNVGDTGTNFSSQNVVEVGGANFELEPGQTDGTVESFVNFEPFNLNSGNIDGFHRIGITQTIDGVDLQEGDVLFSTGGLTSLSLQSGVVLTSAQDIYLFRPVAPGDFSNGTITLYAASDNIGDSISGFTLVEQQTTIGDRTVNVGDILFGSTTTNNVHHYDAASGTSSVLIDGNDLGLDCLLYTSPSPRDRQKSRMPSSA